MLFGRVVGVWVVSLLLVAVAAVATHDGGGGRRALIATSGGTVGTVVPTTAVTEGLADAPAPESAPRPPTPETTVTTTTTVMATTVTTTPASPTPGSVLVDDRCVTGVRDPRDGCEWRSFVLEGTMRYADGSPASGVCVGRGLPYPVTARSDASGHWRGEVPGPEASVRLQISDCGSGDPLGVATRTTGPIQLSLDHATLVDIAVTRLSGVEGTVIDARGQPVAGVCVRSGGRQDLPAVRTGTDGRFSMGHVLPGTASVEAMDCPEDLADGFGTIGHFDPPTVTTTAGKWTTIVLHVQVGSGL